MTMRMSKRRRDQQSSVEVQEARKVRFRKVLKTNQRLVPIARNQLNNQPLARVTKTPKNKKRNQRPVE